MRTPNPPGDRPANRSSNRKRLARRASTLAPWPPEYIRRFVLCTSRPIAIERRSISFRVVPAAGPTKIRRVFCRGSRSLVRRAPLARPRPHHAMKTSARHWAVRPRKASDSARPALRSRSSGKQRIEDLIATRKIGSRGAITDSARASRGRAGGPTFDRASRRPIRGRKIERHSPGHQDLAKACDLL